MLAGAAEERAVAAQGDRHLSLGDLGRGELAVPTGGSTGAVSVELDLPPRARQGPETWYLVRLHADLGVSPASGEGTLYVSALVNGRASNQVEVEVERAAACATRLRWSAVDLLEGHTAGSVCGPSLELRSTNFTQYRAIRGGRNRLTFQVEKLGGVELDSLRILDDSGISASPRGPAQLRFGPVAVEDVVSRGERVAIPFVLSNVGDRPARNVTVALEPVPGLEGTSSAVRRYAEIPPASTARGAFPVKARRIGRHKLIVAAVSNANQPAIELELPVVADDGEGESGTSAPILIGGIVLVGLGAGILILGGRRSRDGKDEQDSTAELA